MLRNQCAKLSYYEDIWYGRELTVITLFMRKMKIYRTDKDVVAEKSFELIDVMLFVNRSLNVDKDKTH